MVPQPMLNGEKIDLWFNTALKPLITVKPLDECVRLCGVLVIYMLYKCAYILIFTM